MFQRPASAGLSRVRVLGDSQLEQTTRLRALLWLMAAIKGLSPKSNQPICRKIFSAPSPCSQQ